MGTTLIEELEQAASYFQALAREFGSADGLSMCRKLRRRATRVRDLEAPSYLRSGFDVYRALTGPLPAAPPETPGDPQEKGPTP